MKTMTTTHILLILFYCISCGTEKGSISKINSDKTDEITIQISNDSYHLDLVTEYKKDTLNVIDWEEDKYSNPVIVKQVLKFYNHSQLVKEHELPIKYISKETIKGKSLNVPEVPIIDICYHKGINENYFIVSGSDFCMGVLCPEFIGVYQMNGKELYESVTTDKENKPNFNFKVFLESTGIKINKPDKCTSLIKDKLFWDK